MRAPVIKGEDWRRMSAQARLAAFGEADTLLVMSEHEAQADLDDQRIWLSIFRKQQGEDGPRMLGPYDSAVLTRRDWCALVEWWSIEEWGGSDELPDEAEAERTTPGVEEGAAEP
jgi:hypothetical protein